jgi:hypothetical protein
VYVVQPQAIPHVFWDPAAEPAQVVEMHVPARLSCFYDELAAIFEADQPDQSAFPGQL